MNCVACGRDLPGGSSFCLACGAPQAAPPCAACGNELPPGSAFCNRCGTPVSSAVAVTVPPPVSVPVAERRLTSVLFADLVSYTTLSESRDSEDVRALLSEYFDVCTTVVRRYGGILEKFIGDAVMAVWGVPTAHEDDAERAVRAALELVAQVSALGDRLTIPELAVRAGVVTGEVAANLAAEGQSMVAGDPVNTAARVQSAADPGQVWVDATTRTLTAAAVTYFDAGVHALKGKAEPVQLFRAGSVVAARGGSQRVDGLEAPLVGRDRELRLVKELFHGTEDSGRPRLVVLDGEAGVGKSRLGWEFEKYIDGLSGSVWWHRGRCLSYGDGVAFWALAEAVRGRVGLVEDDSGGVVLEGLDRMLADAVPDQDERGWLRPRVASLLGEESREFAREDLFAAWTKFFERVGGSDPVVLVIDDAQYADQGLLDFLEHLLATSGSPIFVLLLARPELLEAHSQLGGRRTSVIRVEALPDAALAALVDGLVDGFDQPTRDALVRRAEGIPLYAVETVRALVDRDLVQAVGGRYLVTPGRTLDLDAIGAPASLHALVAARLDALSVDERRVLTDASVLGESFSREGIGILAADVPALDAVLAALQRKELIGTDADRFSAERGQFRFVQSVVRQVAYQTLSRRDRKTRHLQVADHLADDRERVDDLAQVVARHLLDAVDAAGPDDPEVPPLLERAADLLVTAGDRAFALGSFADAKRSYSAALPILREDDTGRTARVLAKAALADLRLARPDAALPEAERALAIFDAAGEVLEAAEAAYSLALAMARLGRSDESRQMAEARLEKVSGVPGAELAAARLSRLVASGHQSTGNYADATLACDVALRLAEAAGDGESLAAAINTLAIQQSVTGSRQVAARLFDEGAEISRRHENWLILSLVLGNKAYAVGPLDLGAGIEAARAALSEQTAHGFLEHQSTSVSNLLNWLWLAGRWAEIGELAARVPEAGPEDPLLPLVGGAVDRLRAWAGADTAGLDVEHMLTDLAPNRMPNTREYYLLAASLAKGDLPSAVTHARACVGFEYEATRTSDDFHVFWPLAVRTAIAADDRAAYDELMAHVADETDAALMLSIRGHRKVLRAVGSTHWGIDSTTDVESDLVSGIADLDTYGAVVWSAHAREDLGNHLMSLGRRQEAEPLLAAARTTYEQLGATSWLARLDDRVGAG